MLEVSDDPVHLSAENETGASQTVLVQAEKQKDSVVASLSAQSRCWSLLKRPVHDVRAALISTKWYRSQWAAKLRKVMNGWVVTVTMIVALVLALFLPDLWVIFGVNSNYELDIVLLSVMALFTVELVALSSTDATYLLSFFFFMDIVGTVSMIFDLSLFPLGADATSPKKLAVDSRTQLVFFKATRAAKVGARAGRLTRVLRILEFLPLMGRGAVMDETKGIGSTISNALTNVLATRVAFMTLILVMALPLFGLFDFPQIDNSPKSWTERLSSNINRGYAADLAAEFKMMADFYYRNTRIGPFKACLGSPDRGDEIFFCTDALDDWTPRASEPARKGSIAIVYTNTFMLAFNMHQVLVTDAWLSMAVMLFIILIMVFSGNALSRVVNDLAVRPLERMLATVRLIASTVFNISVESTEQEHDEDEIDVNNSNEMKLLEKVVAKLAIVADLQTGAGRIVATEDMLHEDCAVIEMMAGESHRACDRVSGDMAMVAKLKSHASRARKCSIETYEHGKAVELQFEGVKQPEDVYEECGVSREVYQSLAFNALNLTKAQLPVLSLFAITAFQDQEGEFVDDTVLREFIAAVEKEYMPNPFHNFSHAVDVLKGVSQMLPATHTDFFVSDHQRFSLLVAALAHDLGHPGVNNGFLTEVAHELAIQYNDQSPLENMHCAKLYTIVGKQETNVFGQLARDVYKESRRLCIETILHTDMTQHNAMVKALQLTYETNAEAFMADNIDQEVEVFSQKDTKMLVLECVLHCSDVSNPARAWDVTFAWAGRCLEEFFAQGDKEKSLGIPVQFLNDRDKVNRPNSQIGFVEFMIAPLIVSVVRLWPQLCDYGDCLGVNIGMWADMWIVETQPRDEERAKVEARVERVRKSLDDAKHRQKYGRQVST